MEEFDLRLGLITAGEVPIKKGFHYEVRKDGKPYWVTLIGFEKDVDFAFLKGEVSHADSILLGKKEVVFALDHIFDFRRAPLIPKI